MVHCILPKLTHTISAPLIEIIVKLHNWVASIGMTCRSGKHRPIRIAANIPLLPVWISRIVESLRNALIGRLCIKSWFYNVIGKISIHIFPIVLAKERLTLCIVVPLAKRSLIVSSMSWLKQIHIKPRLIVKPQRRWSTAKRMICDNSLWIIRLQNLTFQAEYIIVNITAHIASQDPNQIFAILIAFS